MSKKISSVIMAVIALVVIIVGISLPAKTVYNSGYYSVPGASFGADFYTYVYDGIDEMVDELDAINNAQVSQIAAARETTKACKAIVISIGLLILAMAVKTFSEAEKKQPELAAPAPQYAPVYAPAAPQYAPVSQPAPAAEPASVVPEVKEIDPAEMVEPEIVDESTVRCPECRTEQRADRSRCLKCGKYFKK